MYITLLILAFIAFLLERRLTYKTNMVIFRVLETLMILIIGFRDVSIGIDTFNYYNVFKACGQFGFGYFQEYSLTSEPGFFLLNILSGKLGLSWSLFCTICACIYIIPVFELIRRKTENIMFGVILFIIAGFFFFPMSTIRQSLAIGICVLSYLLLDNKKTILSVLTALSASLFHVSAIIFIIYLIIQKISLNKKNVAIWIIASVAIVIGLMPYLRHMIVLALYSLSKEYEEMDTGGNLQEVFFVLTFVLPFFFTNNSFVEKHSFELKAILLSAVLLPVLQFHPALGRLYFYFSIFSITLIPSFLFSIKDKNFRIIGIICYVSVYLLLFNYYFEPERCLYPYKLIEISI